MVYNFRKMDDNIFKTSLQGLGRDVTNYYTQETDRILVEPNSSYDGGKIYCKADSWIKRGDIIKISDNWYVISQLSNLASDIFNVGTITLCDVYLTVKLGQFVYEVPAVASKYSGSSNVRGIIDDSVEGKLSFITGWHEEFNNVNDNPYVVLFGKVWQIGDMMNVNNVVNVYCKGAETLPKAQIGISPISLTGTIGERIEVKPYWLNTTENKEITISVNNNEVAEIDNKGRVHFLRRGTVNIVAVGENGTMYISPNITVR